MPSDGIIPMAVSRTFPSFALPRRMDLAKSGIPAPVALTNPQDRVSGASNPRPVPLTPSIMLVARQLPRSSCTTRVAILGYAAQCRPGPPSVTVADREELDAWAARLADAAVDKISRHPPFKDFTADPPGTDVGTLDMAYDPPAISALTLRRHPADERAAS